MRPQELPFKKCYKVAKIVEFDYDSLHNQAFKIIKHSKLITQLKYSPLNFSLREGQYYFEFEKLLKHFQFNIVALDVKCNDKFCKKLNNLLKILVKMPQLQELDFHTINLQDSAHKIFDQFADVAPKLNFLKKFTLDKFLISVPEQLKNYCHFIDC